MKTKFSQYSSEISQKKSSYSSARHPSQIRAPQQDSWYGLYSNNEQLVHTNLALNWWRSLNLIPPYVFFAIKIREMNIYTLRNIFYSIIRNFPRKKKKKVFINYMTHCNCMFYRAYWEEEK